MKIKELIFRIFKGNQKTNKETISKEEEAEALKELQEVHKSLYKHLPKWEEIPLLNCESDKKRILVMDDYRAVTDVVFDDLEVILTKRYETGLDKETIELIDRLKLSFNDVEICRVSSNLAPYIVYKSCVENKNDCLFDFGIIDIIFGDFINKDGKKFYLDGIDIIEYIKNKNPDFKSVIFTGCFLDGMYSREKDKIITKLGEEFYNHNIIQKAESKNKRIQTLIKRLFYEYLD